MRRLIALAALLVLPACAGIPSSGPVTRVADDKGFGESTVRYSPARPADNGSPEQIVRGYLDAMLAFPTSTRTASAFLSPAAAKVWSPAAQVSIYSLPEVARSRPGARERNLRGAESGGSVSVRLGYTEEARLDRQGHYEREAEPRSLTYQLEQVDGQWRIANPQVGLLVNRKFFNDYFRQFNLFYFDSPGRRLVPDPIYLSVGDQLATGLVTSLSGGPTAASQRAVRTYVPPVRTLRPSVPVSADGVADVAFTEDFRNLSEAAQDHLSAQLVWTLRQVPGIESAQIVGGATPLTGSGGAVQSIESWGGFGPSFSRGHAFAIVGNKVVQIDEGRIEPLSGAWGDDARGAVSIAVSDSGVAGVLSGREELRLTQRNGAKARLIDGNDLLGPRWDADANLWVVDRTGAGTRVRVVTGQEIRTIDAPGLADRDVRTFVVSPGGTRYAVSTLGSDGGALRVGAVLRDVKDRIIGLDAPMRVYTSAKDPRSVSWSSDTELAFLADSESGAQVFRTSIDGSSTTGGMSGAEALLPDVGSRILAAGTGSRSDLYVTDERDRLWRLPPDGSWRVVSQDKLTGLTYGR